MPTVHRLFLVSILAAAGGLSAAGSKVIPLWPEGVPGGKPDGGAEKVDGDHVSNIHHPSITVYRADAEKDTGTAVVVCPGGGYTILALGHEGVDVAAWLSEIGVNAFVLRYRLGTDYKHPAPLRDVLRAIRTVRSRADEFGVKPDRIGVLGFSAGGHLASTAATLFDHEDGRTGADIDAVSARPDFAVLVYPVIAFDGPSAHSGSRMKLIGENPSPKLIELLSTHRQVSAKTPPTFLVHAGDDKGVPVENSILFYQALNKAGVPAELHIHETGGHGFGMREGEGTVFNWPARAADWMRVHGWVE